MLSIAIVALALAPLLAGCSGAPIATPTHTPRPPTPKPTNTPVPTPVPVVAVAADESYACFWEGIATSDADDGASVTPIAGGLVAAPGLRFAGASVILAYLGEAEPDYGPLRQAMQNGSHVYVYAAAGQAVPEDIPALVYRNEGAAEAALDAAITHPPHDTPVRLVGLFTSSASDAYRAWAEGVESGRIFVKAVYYADGEDADLGAWMENRLSKTYPGMLDGIYAETAELAIRATDALVAAGRSDIEVFSAEVTDPVLAKMLEYPGILVSATGANPVRAGRMLREAASALLLGLLPESRELLPHTFSSATLEAEWDTLGQAG